MKTYSVWDVEIGSRLGTFASQEEALIFIRTMAATYPREKLHGLSFNWEDAEGRFGKEVVGNDLLDFAASDRSSQEPDRSRGGRLMALGRRVADARPGRRAAMSAATKSKKNVQVK